MKKRWLVLIITIAFAVLFVTLGAQTVFSEMEQEEEEKALVIELHDDYFSPKEITIPRGKKTKIWLKNKGMKEHTFTIEELDVDVELRPGVEKMVFLEPQKGGTFELICRYHEKEGMVGKVHVQ